jgi:hypothetical protein
MTTTERYIEPPDFSHAVEAAGFSAHMVEALRLYIYEGKGYAQAGRAVDPPLKRQHVYRGVQSLMREVDKIEAARGAPPGWIRISVVLPPDAAERVVGEAIALRRAYMANPTETGCIEVKEDD